MVDFTLTAEQVARLAKVSTVPAAYPVWHQQGFPILNERSADLSL